MIDSINRELRQKTAKNVQFAEKKLWGQSLVMSKINIFLLTGNVEIKLAILFTSIFLVVK